MSGNSYFVVATILLTITMCRRSFRKLIYAAEVLLLVINVLTIPGNNAQIIFDDDQTTVVTTTTESPNTPKILSRSWNNQNENLFLAATDDKIAIYYQNVPPDLQLGNMTSSSPAFQTISKAWAHLKKILGSFGSGKLSSIILFIVLHNTTYIKNEDGCTNSITNFNNITDQESSGSLFHTIDCGSSVFSKWDRSSDKLYVDAAGEETGSRKDKINFEFRPFDDVITQLGQMALKLTNKNTIKDRSKGSFRGMKFGRENWPARKFSCWTMTSILSYCVYFTLERVNDLKGWKRAKMNESENFPASNPKNKTYWFRDWYHPIYERYGDSKVLERFFTLLDKHWLIQTENVSRHADGKEIKKQINMGEWVHFWSGAARTNLKDLAASSFGWTSVDQAQFWEARKTFPGPALNYVCENCGNGIHVTELHSSNTVALVVGISISLVVAIVIVFGVKIARDKKKMKILSEYVRNLTSEELNEFRNGSLYVSHGGNNESVPIQSMPFNDSFEISKDHLTMDKDKVLGSGEYGLVILGKMKKEGQSDATGSDREVAIKTAKPNVEVIYFKALLSEIKIIAYLGHHDNIVSLLGTVTDNIKNCEVFVALELCAKGDLLQHLKKCRSNFRSLCIQPEAPKNELVSGTKVEYTILYDQEAMVKNVQDEGISTRNLLEWSSQIANGMAYLTLKNVIHADLAARNVLLTVDNVAKISDFGLSRQLINYSNYLKTSSTPLPWKWLAIESLTDQIFSIHSDEWAFGVTLWEIFTLGKVPYTGRTWDIDFVTELIAGVRLNQPDFGGPEIYDLMLKCMKYEPEERISFEESRNHLEQIKSRLILQ